MRRIPFFCLWLLLVLVARCALGENPAPKFSVADYLKGLAALSDRFANCKGEGVRSSSTTSQAGPLNSVQHYAFAFTRTAGRLVSTELDQAKASTPTGMVKPSRKIAMAYNETYSFILSSPGPDRDYVIDSLEKGPEKVRRIFASPMMNPSRFATHIGVTPIEKLISAPTFHVESVEEIESALGSRCLRVNFTCPIDPTKPKSKLSKSHVSSGWLILSPDLGWLLHEAGRVYSYDGRPSVYSTEIVYVEYARAPDGQIWPTKAGSRGYAGKLNVDPVGSGVASPVAEEFQFTSLRLGDTPAREFTLASFGLPEFAEPAARRLHPPFPWWIVAASVVALGAAAALRFLSRRPRTLRPEPLA